MHIHARHTRRRARTRTHPQRKRVRARHPRTASVYVQLTGETSAHTFTHAGTDTEPEIETLRTYLLTYENISERLSTLRNIPEHL